MKKNRKFNLRKNSIANINQVLKIKGGQNQGTINSVIAACNDITLDPNQMCMRTKRPNISVIHVGGICQHEQCR